MNKSDEYSWKWKSPTPGVHAAKAGLLWLGTLRAKGPTALYAQLKHQENSTQRTTSSLLCQMYLLMYITLHLFLRNFGFIAILEETLCHQSLGQTAGTSNLLTYFPTVYKRHGFDIFSDLETCKKQSETLPN